MSPTFLIINSHPAASHITPLPHREGTGVGLKSPQIGTGWYFGFCLAFIFTFRFFIEYTKEIQEAFEASLPIDMGQILSIPFIVIGVYCMIRARR